MKRLFALIISIALLAAPLHMTAATATDDLHNIDCVEFSHSISRFSNVPGGPGDVDGDGNITSTDARLILQVSVNKISKSDINASGADVDGDRQITSTDARLVLQYSVNKIFAFPGMDGSSAEKAIPLSLNASTVNILKKYRTAWHVFTLEKRGTVIFDFQIPLQTNNHVTDPRWDVKIYRQNNLNDTIYTDSFSQPSYEKAKDINTYDTIILGLEPGTYYISFDSYWGDEDPYIITPQYTQTDYCETEPNNRFADASSMVINQPYKGSLHRTSDRDFYIFTMEKSGTVVFNLQAPMKNGSYVTGPIWNIEIYSQNDWDNALLKHSFSQSTDPAKVSDVNSYNSAPLTLAAGTYYIHFKSYWTDWLDWYNLTVISQ